MDGTPVPNGTESDESGTPIRLEQMAQQREVREPDDDWTGLKDPKARRKLQNRLNARIWRKRQKESKLKSRVLKNSAQIAGTTSSSPSSGYSSSDFTAPTSESSGDEQVIRQRFKTDSGTDLPVPPQFSLSICRMPPRDIQKTMSRFEKWVHQNYLIGSPRVDLLLTLIQFNVFRALFSNTFSLGFDLAWLNEDAVSPFSTTKSGVFGSTIPESLRPTKLQRTVTHHPWIDLFPLPEMRDNLLLAGAEYDDAHICADIVEVADISEDKVGLIVWGEPWDPYAWEATPQFLKKWAWVVKGCNSIIESTNYWRLRRGEERIST